jgi:polyphosphate kinase 2 (PPK2 family)
VGKKKRARQALAAARDPTVDGAAIDFGARLPKSIYLEELDRLQFELVRLQYWVRERGERVVVLFEVLDVGERRRAGATLQQRAGNPAKLWKLSPMDLLSREHWVEYSKAKDVMMEYTDIPEARSYQIDADDKRRAHLNSMSHLLSLFTYQESMPEPIKLKPRPAPDHRGGIPLTLGMDGLGGVGG